MKKKVLIILLITCLCLTFAACGKTSNTSNTDNSQSSTAQTEKKDTSSDAVSPDVKNFMDEYESFVDEYLGFLEKYKSSTDTASMVSDYSDYVKRLADYKVKAENLKKESLSGANLEYYNEVNARVAKKLMTAGLNK